MFTFQKSTPIAREGRKATGLFETARLPEGLLEASKMREGLAWTATRTVLSNPTSINSFLKLISRHPACRISRGPFL